MRREQLFRIREKIQNDPAAHEYLLGTPHWKEARMKLKKKAAKPITAEAIARLADRGKDISIYFKRDGRMIHPKQPRIKT